MAVCRCQKTFQFGNSPLGPGKLPLQKATSPQVAPSGVGPVRSLPLSLAACSAMLMRARVPLSMLVPSYKTKLSAAEQGACLIILHEDYNVFISCEVKCGRSFLMSKWKHVTVVKF